MGTHHTSSGTSNTTTSISSCGSQNTFVEHLSNSMESLNHASNEFKHVQFFVQRHNGSSDRVPLIAVDELPQNILNMDDYFGAFERTFDLGVYPRKERVVRPKSMAEMERPERLHVLQEVLRNIDYKTLKQVLAEIGFNLSPIQPAGINPTVGASNSALTYQQQSSNPLQNQLTYSIHNAINSALPRSEDSDAHNWRPRPATSTTQTIRSRDSTPSASPYVLHDDPTASLRPSRALPNRFSNAVGTGPKVAPPGKIWCNYWIQRGECSFMQQGCKYRHEMPDLQTLESIGFKSVPFWYREKQRKEREADWRVAQDLRRSDMAFSTVSAPTRESSRPQARISALNGRILEDHGPNHTNRITDLFASDHAPTPRPYTGRVLHSLTPSPIPQLQSPILPFSPGALTEAESPRRTNSSASTVIWDPVPSPKFNSPGPDNL